MFQISHFPANGLTIVHPPEMTVSPNMLFESEVMFVWDELQDPHVVRRELGRFIPFASALIEDHHLQVSKQFDQWDYSLQYHEGNFVHGALLIGLTSEEIEILDHYVQVPFHRRRDKIKCRVGTIERVAQIYLQQGSLLAE